MVQNIIYFLEQYLLLALFVLSILGWGRLVCARFLATSEVVPKMSMAVLQAATGLGLITVLLQFIAAYGALTTLPLLAIVLLGILLFVAPLIAKPGRLKPELASIKIGHQGLVTSILVFLAAAAFLSNALVRPLRLPQGWDEIAYHLPTAQAWAESGSLVVTDWLRYPLFPFNMELLYAGSLVLSNDITAHLIHALTGLLAAALTFSVARIFIPVGFSVLAPVFLIYAIREPLQTADVDLGLMLYIFCAFASLAFSYIAKQKHFVLLSAFFIGLALGTKYQAMFFLPALGISFLLVERNLRILALAALIAIATGLFWYARNVLVSGDPIHPIGGSVFGYWQWSAEDVRRQFMDFHGRGSLPPWYLLLSLGSFIFWKSSVPVVKGCMAMSVVTVILWSFISGYARYLLPIYPLLAILSSYFLYKLFVFFQGYQIFAKYWSKLSGKVQVTAIVVLLLVIILDWGKSTKKDIGELVLPNSVKQISVISEAYPGFELLDSLDEKLYGTLYQLGFEDEIYYLGTPILGDHFGKARYLDVLQYFGDSAALSGHLRSLGVNYLMINLVRNAEDNHRVSSAPNFGEYFEKISDTPRAVLYRLKGTENGPAPRQMLFRSGLR